MAKIGRVKEMKPMQQSVGRNVGVDSIETSYNDGSKNGNSQTPLARTMTNSNKSSRPTRVSGFKGPSGQKIRG